VLKRFSATLDEHQQFSLHRLYFIVALVVTLVVSAAVILTLYNYEQANKQVISETHNLANSLVLTFDGMIDTIDIALQASGDEIASLEANGKPDKTKIDEYLLRQRKRVASLVSLRATDENGNLMYGLENEGLVNNVADREYYSEPRNHPEYGLYISKPIVSRINKQWIWLFSRRIVKPDGTFGGVVSCAVLTDEINNKLGNITMPRNSSISLRHRTMELVARADYDRSNVIPTGSNKLSQTLIDALKENSMEGSYTSDITGLDKIIKTYYYVTSKKYGFFVIAGISRDVALAAWKKQVVVVSVLISIFVLGALVFVFFIRSALVRRDIDMKTIQANHCALQELNTELEGRVEARTAELTETLANLRETQRDLVQSEKLASLGSIVVGISHEINTPIGNAITLTSIMTKHLAELQEQIDQGKMSKSNLVAWIDYANETVNLVDRSVNRVANLVSSFKQLAIEQTSERLRRVDLRDVLEDMVTMLRPTLKQHPWVLENTIPSGIIVESYIGSLEQIIINLVNNAVLHAFEGREQGKICFSAVADNEKVKISIVDDGVGMSADVLAHVFDPFFTTKLGKGGSGLGLTVSRRIANNILEGDLQVYSTAGIGSRFVLILPKRVTGKF